MRRGWLAALVLVCMALAGSGHGHRSAAAEGTAWLTGQVLIAVPRMADPRFAGTVIYVVNHDAGGAMGLVVNRAFGRGRLAVLLETLGFSPDVVGRAGDDEIRLQYGGPVEPGRGFVLHSADYTGESTRKVAGNIAVSGGRDVFEALVSGRGPARARVVLGYAGWGPGQLESEMAREDWLTAPGDETLIFDDDLDRVWQRAMEASGLTL